MDPDAETPRPAASAPAKGEPGGGGAADLGAPPDPSLADPPPRPGRLALAAKSVLRVLLATLALGWWTQDVMRRHFDSGPYTGPLYRFETDDDGIGLMDDTGRIVVPAGVYRELRPIGGWRSAWIGWGTRTRYLWNTSKPFLYVKKFPDAPVIVQAGAASRPLGLEVTKVPLVLHQQSQVLRRLDPRAYRLSRYPELLELYRDALIGNIDGRLPEPRYDLRAVRLTDGATLLSGQQVFRLSLSPPTYLVCDGAAAGTVQRWDGARFVPVATFSGPLPRTVSVLNAAPLTFLVRDSYAFQNAEEKGDPAGDFCVYQMQGDRMVALGRYLTVELRNGNGPPTTDLVSEVYGDAIPDPEMDYVVAIKAEPGAGAGTNGAEPFEPLDAGARMLLSRTGKELPKGEPRYRATTTEYFIRIQSPGTTSGNLVARATGAAHPYRSARVEASSALAAILREDGSWQVLDGEGRTVGEPAWEFVTRHYQGPDLLIVQLNGKRGVWSPDAGYLLPPRFTYLSYLSEGVYAVSEEGSLRLSGSHKSNGSDYWVLVGHEPDTPRLQQVLEPDKGHGAEDLNYGVLDTQGRWLQPPGPGLLRSIYRGSAPRWYSRQTDSELRVYDHDWRLQFTRPGHWHPQVRAVTLELFEVLAAGRQPGEPARHFVHADGSAAPDDEDAKAEFQWLDGERLTVRYPDGQVGLRTADGEWPLGPERYRQIRQVDGSKLIALELNPVPVSTHDSSSPAGTFSVLLTDLYRLYDPETGALSPLLHSGGSSSTSGGWHFVNLAVSVDPPEVVNALFQGASVPPTVVRLGEDLQPLPGFLNPRYSQIISVDRAASGYLDRSPIAVTPGAGSWKSADSLFFALDGQPLWRVIDAEGHAIAPVADRRPTIVDARFLSFQTKLGTVLVDRHGHTVTPRE